MQSKQVVLSDEWNLQSWEGRQYETSVRKDTARRREAVHSERKKYSLLNRHHCTRLQHECITHWLPSSPWNDFFIDLQRFTKQQCFSNSYDRTSNSSKQHTDVVVFNCFLGQSNWNNKLASARQHHNSLVRSRECSCCEMDG